MNTARSILAGVAVVAFSGLVAGPAQAATEHCPGHNAPDSGKVETDGSPTVYTGLEEGTTVCYKAGTQVGTAVVDADGNITSTILNKNGNGVLGVSYFVPGEDNPI